MTGTVSLEGFHAVKHALRFAPELVHEVRVRDVGSASALAERLAPDVVDALLARAVVAEVGHHTGVEASAARPVEDLTALTARAAPLVLLDHPRTPGNAGAVVRVAAAAGASGVGVVGPLDPWHPTVLRGSAGLHFALPVMTVEIASLTGPFVVLDADGDPDAGLPADAVLVVGSERSGVGAELRARADLMLALPMRPGVSSLNLATATAAALYRSRLSAPGGPVMVGGDDPRRGDVRALLDRHLSLMLAESPPEIVHALDVHALLHPAVTFCSGRDSAGTLLGVGALQHLDAGHVELTSVHTAVHARGRGVERALLDHLLALARARGCTRVSLETGSTGAFAAGRSLYASAGFVPCPPFGAYIASDHCTFLTLDLG